MATIETSITIEQAVLDQAQELAQQLNISQDELLTMAIEQFIARYQPTPDDKRVINQGDLYWLRVNDADSDIAHPHVVIQDNLLNHSRIPTVVVCALTSNLKRLNMPGNVLLDDGEANLTRQSIVEVSKLSTIEKSQLGEYIGTLSEAHIQQILDGIRLLQSSFFPR